LNLLHENFRTRYAQTKRKFPKTCKSLRRLIRGLHFYLSAILEKCDHTKNRIFKCFSNRKITENFTALYSWKGYIPFFAAFVELNL